MPAATADSTVSMVISDEEDDLTKVPPVEAASSQSTDPPKWLQQKGMRRIMSEFRAVSEVSAQPLQYGIPTGHGYSSLLGFFPRD